MHLLYVIKVTNDMFPNVAEDIISWQSAFDLPIAMVYKGPLILLSPLADATVAQSVICYCYPDATVAQSVICYCYPDATVAQSVICYCYPEWYNSLCMLCSWVQVFAFNVNCVWVITFVLCKIGCAKQTYIKLSVYLMCKSGWRRKCLICEGKNF